MYTNQTVPQKRVKSTTIRKSIQNTNREHVRCGREV